MSRDDALFFVALGSALIVLLWGGDQVWEWVSRKKGGR